MSVSQADPFLAEEKLGLLVAAKLVPSFRGGRPTHASTLFRWITAGVKLPAGRRLHLQGQRIGGRWVTSAGALQRFSDELTSAYGGEPADEQSPAPKTAKARRRAAEAAIAELQAAGA